MKNNSSVFNDLFFIIFFPGYLVYHYLAAINIIPTFLGGYMGVISLILLIPVSITYFKLRTNGISIKLFELEDIFFLLFLLYFSTIVSFNFFNGANQIIVREHYVVILEFYVVYSIYRNLDLNRKIIYYVSWLVCIFTLLFVFNNSDFFYYGENDHATYQGISLMLLMISIIIIPKLNLSRFFIYFIVLSSIYLLGARFEFLLFFCLIYVNEFYLTKQKIVFFLLFLLIIIVVVIYPNSFINFLPDSRVKRSLLIYFSSDRTLLDLFSDRFVLLFNGLKTIMKHPIMGRYGSYEPGSYIHNILSSWVDLGILGFLFILFILLFPIVFLIYNYNKQRKNSDYLFLLLMCTFTSLSLIIAKSFVHIGVPALWGTYIRIKLKGKL